MSSAVKTISILPLACSNTLILKSGSTTVYGISTNSALTENSDSYLSTQKAVKTYSDNLIFNNYTEYWTQLTISATGWITITNTSTTNNLIMLV